MAQWHIPDDLKIYHIVHADRLESIVRSKALFCDVVMCERQDAGSTIGMSSIKQRRLQTWLSCHEGLRVGNCVPFYFCPRSVMLYVIYKRNHPELTYMGGQEPIVHLEFDLHAMVNWADRKGMRWAFTTSNAGTGFFNDYCRLEELKNVNWPAVRENYWVEPEIFEAKQAEFLVEQALPFRLVERIGVHNTGVERYVRELLTHHNYNSVTTQVMPMWYY